MSKLYELIANLPLPFKDKASMKLQHALPIGHINYNVSFYGGKKSSDNTSSLAFLIYLQVMAIVQFEAVVGLLIEISFIATFTQGSFGK